MMRGWKARLLEKFPLCLVCGTTESLTVDHVVPLALGGKHEFENLQVLCLKHNSQKGAKILDYRLDK